jgi:arylsulfatase A-like enzyme
MIRILIILFAAQLVAQNQVEQRPNIVFIISDQHKINASGVYGSELAITPHIDALAKTGILFTNAYTPAPVCAPARASYITGMYPYANGAIYHKAPVTMTNGKVKYIGSGYLRETGYHEGIETLGDVFRNENYITAAPGKMHVHGELQKDVDEDYKQGNDLGFDESSLRYYTYFPGGHYQDEVGEDTYMRYRQFKKYMDTYKKGPMHLNEEYLPTLVVEDEDNFDMVVTKKSIEFINRRAEDKKPFFVHVGLEKPHPPFTTAQRYLDMHKPEDFQLPETYDDWYKKGKYPWVPNWVHSGIPKDLKKAQNVMASYNACVTQVDDMVGRIVKSLKDNGLYENTIIIYTSDHGEHLFEHGLRGKHNMYDASVKVPFIISYPKKFKQNVVNHTAISLIDMMPTFADLIDGKTPKTAQGISLADVFIEGKEIKDRVVYSEFRGGDYKLLPNAKNVPSRMMREGDYKFIYTHGIIDQLYNVKEDPNELNNLIFDAQHQNLYRDMYFQTLSEWRFQEYTPMQVVAKGKKLKWRKSDEFSSYMVYFAPTNDPTKATMVAHDIEKNTYVTTDKGVYWVVAKPVLRKTSQFYGALPVAVETYSNTLPVSDPVVMN